MDYDTIIKLANLMEAARKFENCSGAWNAAREKDHKLNSIVGWAHKLLVSGESIFELIFHGKTLVEHRRSFKEIEEKLICLGCFDKFKKEGDLSYIIVPKKSLCFTCALGKKIVTKIKIHRNSKNDSRALHKLQ